MLIFIIMMLGFFLLMGYIVYLIHKENMYKLENNIKENDDDE